jgi:hypothetical protein
MRKLFLTLAIVIGVLVGAATAQAAPVTGSGCYYSPRGCVSVSGYYKPSTGHLCPAVRPQLPRLRSLPIQLPPELSAELPPVVRLQLSAELRLRLLSRHRIDVDAEAGMTAPHPERPGRHP